MFDCGYKKAQYIDGQREKFVRLEESSPRSSVASNVEIRTRNNFNMASFGSRSFWMLKAFKSWVKNGSESLSTLHQHLTSATPKTAFPEDLKSSKKTIFDPQSKFLLRMNRVFFASCIVAVAVDPLFFYLPVIQAETSCVDIDRKLAITATIVRTIIDCIYLIRVVLLFRTAYVAPSSRVSGTGELVIDPLLIARRYLSSYFSLDFLAVLPLPQIFVWRYLHSLATDVRITKDAVRWIVLVQYVPRLLRIAPLTSDMKRSSGVFIETAWAGATYYLLWFMLAGHNVGTFWYLLSLERENGCWHSVCQSFAGCEDNYLYCGNHDSGYASWASNSTQVLNAVCSSDNFQYGIYQPALQFHVVEGSTAFVPKLFFCFWWGFQSLSTLGQGLITTTYPGEAIFSIAICVIGLVLFALLIGNMQTYLQSLTIRLEEMRIKKRDAELWMHHRVLPQDIKERVRQFERYKWLETRGVHEEDLVETLPKDLKRDIKRHLCLGLVKRVPLFENMDERLLDAICERLKPALYTENSYILREGDPVDEMLFILHGRMESVTTDGGRSGFFNRGFLNDGDFCGEELLTWALDPKSSANFPTSTRTVKALSEIEAFALMPDELKFVASQFRRLHSRQVQHTFRFYSQQWRTWAACFIQAAWRRYCKRKMAELRRREETAARLGAGHSLGAAIYASRFAANAMRGVHRLRSKAVAAGPGIIRVPKPSEPDFGVDDSHVY